MDYKVLADQLVKKCIKKGADAAEVYIQKNRELSIEVRNGEVETVQENATQGAGFRVFVKGKMAFSHCNDFSDAALESWLILKGKQHGFEVIRDKKTDLLKFQAESYLWHPLTQKGRKAGFSSVDFDGVLQIIDPILLAEALYKGIGPAKAFGCGLMLVRRI